MSGLETAIRNALERSERANAETRARIYQSARQALEAGLQKQGIEDVNVIAQQRHRLEAVIHAIETEERAALRARQPAPPVASLGDATRSRGSGQPRVEPQVQSPAQSPAQSQAQPQPEAPAPGRREPGFAGDAPRQATGDGGLGSLRADRDGPVVSTRAAVDSATKSAETAGAAPEVRADTGRKRRRKRSRLLSFTMVVVTLAAAAGAAVWWVQTNDLLKSAAERDTNVANPPASVASEDFDGAAGLQTLGAQQGFTGDWVEVFTPEKAAAVVPGTSAKAEPLDDEGGRRLQLTSSVAEAEGDITIEIPAAVLAELSGKTSTLALTVQAQPGKTTEFVVECNFSSLGECGRHRFTVHDERLDMLFKITFDRSLAPNSPGQIVINSDISGEGKSLSLYAIRVLPGQ
ncbi:biotin transporter BioY [Ensifer sp. LC13]|uniref:biotin transporter BioY n=1 Tax=unclassified Ensifer TaxID=2633371 RepID=UPI000813C8CC|nr:MULTISPECIES: biotin transporter BioY [unclassified Ensifer]OCO98230.1 biotin transporter BioY [Ensifer sp. LC13]OCP14465.1 biotin transporter BioY [Ensifer sp. LC11]OCP29123.1 biotin transporter BioY [Ensifer sp. LC499]